MQTRRFQNLTHLEQWDFVAVTETCFGGICHEFPPKILPDFTNDETSAESLLFSRGWKTSNRGRTQLKTDREMGEVDFQTILPPGVEEVNFSLRGSSPSKDARIAQMSCQLRRLRASGTCLCADGDHLVRSDTCTLESRDRVQSPVQIPDQWLGHAIFTSFRFPSHVSPFPVRMCWCGNAEEWRTFYREKSTCASAQ